MQKRSKHRLRVKAPVIAETILVQVRLKVFPADRVVYTADAPLDEAPEALHSVCVNVAHHIHLFAVLDSFVVVAASL